MASKHHKTLRRSTRVRSSVRAAARGRPRLSVFRSANNIYAQVIDDAKGHTLASASTLDEGIRKESAKGGDMGAAAKVGTLVAKRAKEAGVTKVVFDRGAYLFHGRVKALADAARESGLEF